MEENFFEYKDNFAKYKHIKSNLLVGEIENIPNPKITIAIPTYKRYYLIKDALNSAINQVEFKNYEVIVVDNEASQEENETEKLIKQYNNPKILYYKNEENIGMFGNWNRCVELARGEYVTILNDDDWLNKNFLYEIMRNIKKDNAISVVSKIYDYRKKENNNYKKNIIKKILKKIYKMICSIKKIKQYNILDFFYMQLVQGTLGTVYIKKYFVELGGFNEEYYPTSDYIFQANFFYKYGIKLLNKELAYYRIQQNESFKREIGEKWILQLENFREFLVKNFIKDKKYYKKSIVFTEIYKNKLEFWDMNFKYNLNENKIEVFKIKLRNYYRNIFA